MVWFISLKNKNHLKQIKTLSEKVVFFFCLVMLLFPQDRRDYGFSFAIV
jgi:hypothetical protein